MGAIAHNLEIDLLKYFAQMINFYIQLKSSPYIFYREATKLIKL